MANKEIRSTFSAKLLRPKKPGDGEGWAFVVLPKEVSANLPRRGRTSVDGTLNGQPFNSLLLEPDGRKSHWLRIDKALMAASHTAPGDVAEFGIAPVARVDWIHWVVTAKQAKTRAKRINDALDKLASGEKRVCCFDPSGFYSKALSAPEADA